MENNSFWATIYKADNAFYRAGRSVPISCQHIFMGVMGINTVGQIVSTPDAVSYSPPSPPSSVVPVPQATIFPSPTAFGNSEFKSVTMVKDMLSLVTYYVDTASYNANVVQCNPAINYGNQFSGSTSSE